MVWAEFEGLRFVAFAVHGDAGGGGGSCLLWPVPLCLLHVIGLGDEGGEAAGFEVEQEVNAQVAAVQGAGVGIIAKQVGKRGAFVGSQRAIGEGGEQRFDGVRCFAHGASSPRRSRMQPSRAMRTRCSD